MNPKLFETLQRFGPKAFYWYRTNLIFQRTIYELSFGTKTEEEVIIDLVKDNTNLIKVIHKIQHHNESIAIINPN